MAETMGASGLGRRWKGFGRTWLPALLVVSLGVPVAGAATSVDGNRPPGQEPEAKANKAGTNDDERENAAEADAALTRPMHWNEFEGPLSTLRLGFGFLVDAAVYDQDEASKRQADTKALVKLRDFRILMNGRLKPFEGRVSWTLGIMYDGPSNSWILRQTGVMLQLPERWGSVFIGRSKEGISMNKIMVGYTLWTMERATFNEATLPILADGVKWLGYLPRPGIAWNAGLFVDWISDGQSFSSYEYQAVGRVAWLPVRTKLEHTLLHLGVAWRYGEPVDEQLQLRSRPESVPGAPFFIDTGRFPADNTQILGLEAYFRSGGLQLGSEYFFMFVDSTQAGDPLFHGGEVFLAWLMTGEVRPYKPEGAYFLAVSPTSSVFDGGFGALEAVVRFSYSDFDDGTIAGGRFWRITPMLNWYLSSMVRLEFVYGYGVLDRAAEEGGTQFFQTRLQLSL